jgi:hypothetical protein
MENMNTNEIEGGSIKYSIHLIDGKVITSKLRKKTDLCPICKNGAGCENTFAHGRLWT